MANRTFALAVLALSFFQVALASLYVINPSAKSTCHGGQPCTIDWLDDGQVPLLSTMGPSTVGLYTGNMQLVQQLDPIDVSSSLTLTFTYVEDLLNPNAQAGSDSHDYYVAFTSTTAKNDSGAFQAFSPIFSIDQMSGSFDSPVASLTSAKPVPSSVANDSPVPVSTVTIENSKALAAPSSASTTSAISTSPRSSSSSQSSGFTKVSASSAQPANISPPSSNVSSNGAFFPKRSPSALNLASSIPFLLCLFLSYPSGHP